MNNWAQYFFVGVQIYTCTQDIYVKFLFFLQNSGLYEYKVYGVLDDVQPDICAQVYVDNEYRKEWDSYVKGMYVSPHMASLIFLLE